MNQRFNLMMRLRGVFEATKEGMGLASALVLTFAPAGPQEREVARRILLGFPVQMALQPVISNSSRELSMLGELLAGASGSSAKLIGSKGEGLSITLERWLKMKEEWAMQRKVMQMRSHLMSGVLGAVVAMLAALGPVVASLNLTGAVAEPSSSALTWATAAMVCLSSATLGLFMSGRRFYLDVVIALASFSFVFYAVAPLANIPVVSLWGIK